MICTFCVDKSEKNKPNRKATHTFARRRISSVLRISQIRVADLFLSVEILISFAHMICRIFIDLPNDYQLKKLLCHQHSSDLENHIALHIVLPVAATRPHWTSMFSL